MSVPIIATKLFMPPLRPECVARPRLTETFTAGLARTVTLVSAPAGFGKSTLVGDSLSRTERPVAWLSLDAADGEFKRFLRYLIAAIARVAPSFGDAIQVSLDAPQPPPQDTLLAMLLNALAALEAPLVMVLDDYHVIDASAVDQALAFVLAHSPPHVHWVITTREDPQLPLARWRTRGQLAEIRAADLRFTREEAHAFLTGTMHVALSEGQVAALDARTEGWIAGLQMAALSLQGRSDPSQFIQDFTGSHRFVMDYLVEEVLQQRDPETRDFLLQTSVLDRLCGPLCDAVTLHTGSEQRLHQLEKDNLFVLSLDDQRCWYRYHHLFAEVLRARLMQADHRVVPDLHIRASQWCEQQGHSNEAIQHALAAQDVDRAAALIEAVWPDLRKSASESLFLGWMAALPAAPIRQRPTLCAYFGLGLLSSDLPRGVSMLDTAENWLALPRAEAQAAGMVVSNEAAFIDLPAVVAVGRAYQAGAEGDLDGIVSHAQRALAMRECQCGMLRGSAAILLGLVYWNQGALTDAYDAIEDGCASMQAVGEHSGAISALNLLATLRMTLGDLRQAARLCEQGQRLAHDLGGPAPQGTADICVTLAAIKTEQLDLDGAQQLLDEARRLGPQATLLESANLWFVVQALIASGRGDQETALQLLDDAEKHLIPSPAPSPMPLPAWRARVHLLQGQLSRVEHWVTEAHISPDDELMYLREFEHMVLLRLLLAQFRATGDPAVLSQAQQLVARLLAAASDGQRHLRVIEAQVLQSLLHDAAGQSQDSQASLDAALRLAEPQQMVAVFVREGEPLRALLQKTQKHCATPDYAKQLLAAFQHPATARHAAASPSLPEPLSEREREVLRLLASDLTGPEIAGQLYVSLNTLRTHTKNIYAKLAVNNRRAAVTRAKALGL